MLEDGWADDVVIEIDDAGMIQSIESGADPRGCERIEGAVLPGMGNLHSHAFQRAMAGLAEQTGTKDPGDPRLTEGDDFWGWRDVMYGFLARLAPDQVEAIAGWLYLEMLKGGYTRSSTMRGWGTPSPPLPTQSRSPEGNYSLPPPAQIGW